MNWEECKKKGFVKEKSPRQHEIESLLISSKKKFISYERLSLSEDTASSKVGLLYDSVRILLEALSVQKGFKIYSHECIGCFLKEVVDEKEMSETFDKYRVIRNGFNYYGEDVSVDAALVMIKELTELRLHILRTFFGGFHEKI